MGDSNIPVVTTVHNNHAYLENFLKSCRVHGLTNFIVIDSASTNEQTKRYLNENSDQFKLISLSENLGPRYSIHSTRMKNLLPNVFILSDPDIELPKSLPQNFIAIMLKISKDLKIAKVGLALDISSEDIDKNLITFQRGRNIDLIESEKHFWKRVINITEDDSPVFDAAVDTTFCLFNRDFFDANNELKGVRIGGNFTCVHLPWLKQDNKKIPEDFGDSYLLSSLKSVENQVLSGNLHQQLYISYLKIIIENLNIEIQLLNDQLQSAYSSKSWQITKPLRAFINLFKN